MRKRGLLAGMLMALLAAALVLAQADITINTPAPNSTLIRDSVRLNVTTSESATCSFVLCSVTRYKVPQSSWEANLSLSENLDSGVFSAVQHELRNLTTRIGEDEFSLLEHINTSNGYNSYEYFQYIYFDETHAAAPRIPRSVVHTTDDDEETNLFFYVPDGDQIARYALEFVTPASSSVVDVRLPDFEDKNLTMLGRNYVIASARKTSAGAEAGVSLALLYDVQEDTLQLGDAKTYTVDGTDYTIELAFISSTQARFSVNGTLTAALQEGDYELLAGNNWLVLRDITYQDFGGGIQQAELYLGNELVVLTDTNIADNGHSAFMRVDNETIDNAPVVITGTNGSTNYSISTIQWNITADDDVYVAAGEKVSDKLDEAQGLLGAWDIEYAGLSESETEVIRMAFSSLTGAFMLEFLDAEGYNVTFPFATRIGNKLKMGTSNHELVLHESGLVRTKDYFLLRNGSQTYAFRYLNATSTTVSFTRLGPDTEVNVPVSDATNITINGRAYAIWNTTLIENSSIYIDMDGDGVQNTLNNDTAVNITTNNGAVITFAKTANGFNDTGNQFNGSGLAEGNVLTVTVTESEKNVTIQPSPIAFNISDALTLQEATTVSNLNYITPEGEANTNYAYTAFSTKVRWNVTKKEVAIEHPLQQRAPRVFLIPYGSDVTAAVSGENVMCGNSTLMEAAEETNSTQFSMTVSSLANTINTTSAETLYILNVSCTAGGITTSATRNFTVNATDADGDGVFDLEDNCPNVYNPKRQNESNEEYIDLIQRDFDNDGLGDECDDDVENDGIPDIEDAIVGDKSFINTSMDPSVEINNSANLSANYSSLQQVRIRHNSDAIVEFNYDFSTTTLDLRNITIDVSQSIRGGMFFSTNLNITNKTAYIYNVNSLTTLCIKDAPISSFDEISALCNGEDEVGLTCPGTSGQYTCEGNSSSAAFKVSGLDHSGVQQQSYCGDGVVNAGETCSTCPADAGVCAEPSSPSGGSSSGGGGGGGGIALASTTPPDEPESNVTETVSDNSTASEAAATAQEGETEQESTQAPAVTGFAIVDAIEGNKLAASLFVVVLMLGILRWRKVPFGPLYARWYRKKILRRKEN